MRVKNHISLLLAVVITGGLGLTLTAGISFWQIRSVSESSGLASKDFQLVETFVADSYEWLSAMDLLTSESSGVFLIAERLTERCIGDISRLKTSQISSLSRLIEEIDKTFADLTVAGGEAAVSESLTDSKRKALERFDVLAETFVELLEDLEAAARVAANRQTAALETRWSRTLWMISVITILYVVVVILVHRWTARQLVKPLQALAGAAERSVTQDQPFGLEEAGPSEVRALTRSVASSVAALHTRIEQLIESRNVQMRQKKELEETDRLKSQFLANMSHEVRTPLNIICGLTELAQDVASNAEQKKHLGMVLKAGDDLLTIVNDILDLSKIEAGTVELQTGEFDVHDMLAETVKVLGLKASQKGVNLSSDVGRDLPERVIGDEGRLRQVLLNLVGNAIKFTDDGRVLVRAELEDGEENSIHFIVTDTGVGIPAAMQDVIFEPFRQADGSVTRRFGGTGLGLTISRQLVEAMGGRIWLQSEAGKGSVFHFTARFAKPKPAATIEKFRSTPILGS